MKKYFSKDIVFNLVFGTLMILVGLFNLNEYVHYGTVTMHKEQMAFSGGEALTILITEFVGGSTFVFYSISLVSN